MIQERLRVTPRGGRELAVILARQGGDPEPRQAALGQAKDVAFPAQGEVRLRQLEPVGRPRDREEPLELGGRPGRPMPPGSAAARSRGTASSTRAQKDG